MEKVTKVDGMDVLSERSQNYTAWKMKVMFKLQATLVKELTCWYAVEDKIPSTFNKIDRDLVVSTTMSTILKYLDGPVLSEVADKMTSPKELWNAIAKLFGESNGQGKCNALVQLLQTKSTGPLDKNEYLAAFDKARLNSIAKGWKVLDDSFYACLLASNLSEEDRSLKEILLIKDDICL